MQFTALMTFDNDSLCQPSWKTKAFENTKLTDSDFFEVSVWGQELAIPHWEMLYQLISKKENFFSEEKLVINKFSSIYMIKMLEKAGLDIKGNEVERGSSGQNISCFNKSLINLNAEKFLVKIPKENPSINMPSILNDYEKIIPDIFEQQGIVDAIHIKHTQNNIRDLLILLKKSTFKIGLGVINAYSEEVESAEFVRDQILMANEIIMDPARLFVTPDSGLKLLSWDISYAKLKSMVAGRNLAAASLGINVRRSP